MLKFQAVIQRQNQTQQVAVEQEALQLNQLRLQKEALHLQELDNQVKLEQLKVMETRLQLEKETLRLEELKKQVDVIASPHSSSIVGWVLETSSAYDVDVTTPVAKPELELKEPITLIENYRSVTPPIQDSNVEFDLDGLDDLDLPEAGSVHFQSAQLAVDDTSIQNGYEDVGAEDDEVSSNASWVDLDTISCFIKLPGRVTDENIATAE